jgi:hypothetical protein
MSAKRSRLTPTTTLPFDTFWSYLQAHPNCILQAGTPEASLHDDEDFHWHFTSEPDGTLVVEVIRGKKLIGDLAIPPAQIAYVQVEAGEHEEFRFDCIGEGEKDRVVHAYFVMSHAYEGDAGSNPDRWTH